MSLNKLDLIFIEDDDSNISSFEEFCTEFGEDNKDVEISYRVCKSEEETYSALISNTFNAAIIDLNLKGDSDAGVRIIDRIHEEYRIPMIVFSGNATKTEDKQYVLKSVSKGTQTYGELLDELYKFNKTGIMRILGKTGKLESFLDKIFWDNLHPKMPKLQEYLTEGDIEKDLLRYIIHHFNEILEDGVKYVFPEEMYICPPLTNEMKTGSIIQKKDTSSYYIVMTPACDIQQGCDSLIVSRIKEINSLDEIKLKHKVFNDAKLDLENYYLNNNEENRSKKEIRKLEANIKSNRNNLLNKLKGYIERPSNRHHFIYANKHFDNSIIDFHDLETIRLSELSSFDKVMSITSPFFKDIQSRFSSYYARQGSPDYNTSLILEKYESIIH